MPIYVGGVFNAAPVARRVIGPAGTVAVDDRVIELAQKVAAELVVAGWDPVQIVDAPNRTAALAGQGKVLYSVDST